MRSGRLLFVCFLLALLALSACQPGARKRAIGYLRLGPVKNFSAPEVHLPELSLVVRRDSGGFQVMSTMCTFDLSRLEPRQGPQGVEWVSSYSESRYDNEGRVLNPPARANLPFFKMVLEASVLGGPKDTLYVMDGIEVPREWRLKIPEETAAAR